MRGYPLHRVLREHSTFLGEATARGHLVNLGRYPGMIDGAGRVRGEVYRLDDPELLPVLDREEVYNFERRRAIVTLANGRRARAWIYRYRGPQNRAVPIPDGDYRRVQPARHDSARIRTGERQWR